MIENFIIYLKMLVVLFVPFALGFACLCCILYLIGLNKEKNDDSKL